MWILTASGEALIDAAKCNRIFAVDKGDAVLVSAAIDGSEKPVTICKCATIKGAAATIGEIAEYLTHGEALYYAPESFIDRPMPKVQDSRVKRRGGS